MDTSLRYNQDELVNFELHHHAWDAVERASEEERLMAQSLKLLSYGNREFLRFKTAGSDSLIECVMDLMEGSTN